MLSSPVILCILFLLVCASSAPPLSRVRILSELREISNQKLTLDVPFNHTKDDVCDINWAQRDFVWHICLQCGIRLSPLKNNLLEWHFSFTGLEDSIYAGGVYHGIIKLHKDYPRKAPTIVLLTPSGRWHVNTEICLSGLAQPSFRCAHSSLINFITTPQRQHITKSRGRLTGTYERWCYRCVPLWQRSRLRLAACAPA